MTGAYPVLYLHSVGSAGPVRSTRPLTRTFRGAPASVPEARGFVAELLAGCPAREVLMTCVSELCANAIAHTDSGNGGVFIVEVDLPRPGVARIAVTDEGGPSLPVVGRLDPMAEGGRGLAMVAACTSRWGYADAYPGRTVWAEACWPVAVPSPGQDLSRSSDRDALRSGGRDNPQRASRRPRLRFRRSSPLPPDALPPDDWPSGPAA